MAKRKINSKAPKFGDYLKELRESKGLSQKEVSEEFGYSTPQFVSNWERGLATPPVKELPRLLRLYGADMDKAFEVLLKHKLMEVEKELRIKVFGKS